MKNYILLPLFFLTLLFFNNALGQTTYTTFGDGNWDKAENWVNGNVPVYDGTSNKNMTINIYHNITLNASFVSGKNVIIWNIFEGATLTITGNLQLANTDIKIKSGAFLIIGTPPPLPEGESAWDFCCTETETDCNTDPAFSNYENSVFSVVKSQQTPSLIVEKNGTFILYGDFSVANNFDIRIDPGAFFDVKGSFVAGNGATVSLIGDSEAGSSASIGCDMDFDQNATLNLEIATLQVDGDLTFGNNATAYLNGSILDVGGIICSYSSAGGSEAFLNFVVPDGGAPSEVYGNMCADFDPDVLPPGITIIPQPIELISFKPVVDVEVIFLNWTTGTEINNDYFTIERSRDLYGWEVLGFVEGAGNSSIPLDYSFTDYRPLDGLGYYRLKQTDFDGAFKYYGPIAAHYDLGLDGLDFKVMKNYTNWVIAVPNDGLYQVEVYNLQGHRLHSERVENTLSIPAPQGAVVIRVTDGFERSASRVVM